MVARSQRGRACDLSDVADFFAFVSSDGSSALLLALAKHIVVDFGCDAMEDAACHLK